MIPRSFLRFFNPSALQHRKCESGAGDPRGLRVSDLDGVLVHNGAASI